VIILQARWRWWRESLKCWEKRRGCFVEGGIVLVLYRFLSVRCYRCKCIYVHTHTCKTARHTLALFLSLSFSLFLPSVSIFYILCLYNKLPFKFALVGQACKRWVACSITENRLSIRPSPHCKIHAAPTVPFLISLKNSSRPPPRSMASGSLWLFLSHVHCITTRLDRLASSPYNLELHPFFTLQILKF
jgi:hypothetical protein